MPKICVDAIEMMEQNFPNDKIAEVLKIKYPQEQIDMTDFTNQLIDMNIVESIDGDIIDQQVINESPKDFQGVPIKLGQWYFNKRTMSLYFLILVINVAIFIIQPELFPHYKDLFLFDSMIMNTLLYSGITFVILLHHEWGHILAARSYGLATKLEIGHRLFLIVLQTDLTPTWKLQPKQRLVPYLGGLLFDNIILFIALISSLISSNPIFQGIMAVIIFDIFIKFIYQCSVFMKTDLYYVLENLTGCYNLMESGKKWISEKISIVKTTSNDVLYETEKKFVRFYAVFYLFSVALTMSLFVFYFVPQLLFVFNNTVPQLFNSVNSTSFWDAIGFILTTIIMISLLLYSWTKKYILKKD
ncbi:hypothetical protein [Radiobacillus sp. PE A8.2]|uniref:hypothetical protein n=1 Tax=Radiobacillus sp. PE A8.2 TaxID=3380349 RepID=UPI00388F27C9